MYKVLVLEDDSTLLETLHDELSDWGYQVDTAKHGEDVLLHTYQNKYDLYVFDINVPYIDGITLLEELRKSADKTPTILLTSKKDISDKIKGFESGCDDYITKPFSLIELKHRINIILKRTNKEDVVSYNDIAINLKNNTLVIKGNVLTIDRKLMEIIHLFLTNPNEIFSYNDIIDKLYKDKIPTFTVIRVHISKINSLFDKKIINNVRGLGYRYDKV